MTRPISRRRMIVLGGLGAVGVATGVTGWIAGAAGAGPGDRLVPGDTSAELAQPLLLDSRDGRLEVALTAALGVRIAGRDTGALGYNGTSPGPTLRVRPGDELAVRLTNGLDQPTNLHTHGLRVSPLGNSDNPFIAIDPGATFDYLYRIPPDHPPGTNWYHAHHHGTVADQIFGGLVGALLVDRGPDLPVAADRILLVSDTTLDGAGRIVGAGAMDRAMGRHGELVLVNGQHQPTISATPGAAQRWRLINTCTSRMLEIRLAGHELVQVAHDGTFLPAPAARDRVVLAPGNRADVVVRATGPGRHALTAEPAAQGGMGGMGGMGGGGMAGGEPVGEPITLATMVTEGGNSTSPPLPAALPAETPPAGRATTQRRIAFRMAMGGMGAGGMAFTIDGRAFDGERDDQSITLGTTEEWTLSNLSALPHPFHLHVSSPRTTPARRATTAETALVQRANETWMWS